MKRRILSALIVALVVFGAIQIIRVPRANPPVEMEVAWDSPRSRELFYRACADCHSHETQWPWYASLAPVSWLVADHVRDGRLEMNISVPDEMDVAEAVKQIRSGQMPPADYRLMHPAARLDAAEKDALVAGLKKTFR